MQQAVLSRPIQQRVDQIAASLARYGVQPIDMRRAGTLETDLVIPPLAGSYDIATSRHEIEVLEAPFRGMPVRRNPATRFRWFLDGTQRTMPVWRFGTVPIVIGIAVVGILERDGHGECLIVPESLEEQVTWIFPTEVATPGLTALKAILEEHGENITDPLLRFRAEDDDRYGIVANDYIKVLAHAQAAAGRVRAAVERDVARSWSTSLHRTWRDDWLVIDGPLPAQYDNALGFVKAPTSQHLFGEDAAVPFELTAGERTSAYRMTGKPVLEDDEDEETRNLILTRWYQRMWPGDGMDAMHALVRLEINGEEWEPERIEDVASWLQAERVPRASNDARWPTLLYPIHLLERMLKRRVEAITAGWPGR